jgi:hypothetical protein
MFLKSLDFNIRHFFKASKVDLQGDRLLQGQPEGLFLSQNRPLQKKGISEPTNRPTPSFSMNAITDVGAGSMNGLESSVQKLKNLKERILIQ